MVEANPESLNWYDRASKLSIAMAVMRQEPRTEPLQVKYFSFEYQPMGELFLITKNPTRHWVGIHDVGLPYVLCRETAEVDDF